MPFGQSDLQTFYVESPTANLVFHAESAGELWFPAGKVYVAADGTIVSPLGLGQRVHLHGRFAGEQRHPRPAPRDAGSPFALPADVQQQAQQLPHAYPRVLALARAVTAHDTTTYDKVQSLIHWIGAHTHYSENIPPLPAGADTVDEFLFGNRVGFCEQISTSLAVMLRSLGIPAREAVGYVPGGYDPITDLYQVHANDAHAWVQVWFPGYGWQNFDPTAVVPLSPPSPGSTALHDVGSALRRIPPVPVVAVGGDRRARRRRGALAPARPATWAERVARAVERAGRRAGPAPPARRDAGGVRRPARRAVGPGASTWSRLAASVEASAYGGHDPPPAQRACSTRRGAPGSDARRRRWSDGCASDVPVPVGSGAGARD